MPVYPSWPPCPGRAGGGSAHPTQAASGLWPGLPPFLKGPRGHPVSCWNVPKCSFGGGAWGGAKPSVPLPPLLQARQNPRAPPSGVSPGEGPPGGCGGAEDDRGEWRPPEPGPGGPSGCLPTWSLPGCPEAQRPPQLGPAFPAACSGGEGRFLLGSGKFYSQRWLTALSSLQAGSEDIRYPAEGCQVWPRGPGASEGPRAGALCL